VKPTFFATAEELRDWLEPNHVTATELLVGFYMRGSGKPSITWAELVDEALCFGWIDSVRQVDPRSPAVFSSQQESVGLLPSAGAELSAVGDLVGNQCQARGDAAETIRDAGP